jgi:hypothetical protein
VNHADRQRAYYGANALLARAAGDFELAVRFDQYVFGNNCPDLDHGYQASLEAPSENVSRSAAEAALLMVFIGEGLAEVSS